MAWDIGSMRMGHCRKMKIKMQKKKFHLSISVQILVFTLLVAFLPVAAMMMLDTYEKQLLANQEQSLVQEARITAVAVADTLTKEGATSLLLKMDRRFDARIRILDKNGGLLADSSVLVPQKKAAVSQIAHESNASQNGAAVKKSAQQTTLYRFLSLPVRAYRKLFVPPQEVRYGSADFYSGKDVYDGEEIKAALSGSYGAKTRISTGGQVSVTLYSAVPVRNGQQVVGAVLVSKSTYRILQNLYELRLDLARIFIWSLVAVMAVTVFLSIRISIPLKKLSQEAQCCTDRNGHFVKESLTGSRRHDEIGDLSRSYSALLRKLAERIKFIESFSADVSHEFKNPLAAIRSSAELAADASLGQTEREHCLAAVTEEVSHMEHLLSGVRKLSRIDGEEGDDEQEQIPVDLFLANIVDRLKNNYKSVSFTLKLSCPSVTLLMEPDRLERMTENLLQNAASFSNKVIVSESVAKDERAAKEIYTLFVEDDGPGVAPENREKIFERFYSTRKNQGDSAGGHTGLGLALVRAVAEAAGGSVQVTNGVELHGARFAVHIPLKK